MITLGFVVAIGLPLAVIVGVVLWPEHIPPDRTVSAIKQCLEMENSPAKLPARRGGEADLCGDLRRTTPTCVERVPPQGLEP
ncbi:hypothetical protein [Nocardia sp. NPDC060249]|uniref:hypothetical protein n=1 Tax=Nocardia sp. NPDC060249 TaxID=3347082 RepID=UPI00364F4D4B